MRLAAVLLALGVLLAGCSGSGNAGAQPTTLPPVTSQAPAPPPSASPSASPIPLPPEAEAGDFQGASAFIGHYFQVLNEAFRSGDSSRLRGLAAEECLSCANYADLVDQYGDAGQRVEPAFFEVREVVAPGVSAGRTVADLTLSSPDRQLIAADGSVVEQADARGPDRYLIDVLLINGSWQVQAVEAT